MMQSDFTDAIAVTKFMKSISAKVTTDKHKAELIKAAYAQMEEEFDRHMSVVAMGQPQRFHHVYEWNAIGVPGAKLWKTRLLGHGGHRVVTFEWRASKTLVPVPDIPPSEDGKQLKQVHVFVWKAPVMEYGVNVNIEPKLSERLAFPAKGWAGHGKSGLIFTMRPVLIRNPGGKAVLGAFTREFDAWWSGPPGQESLERNINKPIEENFHRSTNDALNRYIRRRAKTFSLTSDTAAARKGERMAALVAGRLENQYIKMAEQRRRLLADE